MRNVACPPGQQPLRVGDTPDQAADRVVPQGVPRAAGLTAGKVKVVGDVVFPRGHQPLTVGHTPHQRAEGVVTDDVPALSDAMPGDVEGVRKGLGKPGGDLPGELTLEVLVQRVP